MQGKWLLSQVHESNRWLCRQEPYADWLSLSPLDWREELGIVAQALDVVSGHCSRLETSLILDASEIHSQSGGDLGILDEPCAPIARVSVRIWCLDWCRNDVDIWGFEHGIKNIRKLLVIVPDETEKTIICFFEFPDELSWLLGCPQTIWVACDPCQMDSSRA